MSDTAATLIMSKNMIFYSDRDQSDRWSAVWQWTWSWLWSEAPRRGRSSC